MTNGLDTYFYGYRRDCGQFVADFLREMEGKSLQEIAEEMWYYCNDVYNEGMAD